MFNTNTITITIHSSSRNSVKRKRYRYMCTINVEGRQYKEHCYSNASKYQVIKHARKVVRDCYMVGGRYYDYALEYNPIVGVE